MTTDERGELILALQHTAAMVEGLLTLLEGLLASVEADARPSSDDIDALRRHASVWRTQLDKMRRRLASATVEPPGRVQ
jgi:hypothetical protein